MNYSEYWRVNKSTVDYVELANALRALRKIVRVMDVDAEVVWAGMPASSVKTIELPAILAQGDYPIPGEKMDVLVGLNIHQALHIMEESQHAWGYLSQICFGMKDRVLRAKLAEAGEDIHVDGVAIKRGLPGKYVQKSRAWWRKNYQSDFTAALPNPDGLFGIWTYLVLDEIFSDMSAQEMEEFLQLPRETLETADIESLVGLFCGGKPMPMFEVYGTLLSMPHDYLEPLQVLFRKTPEIVNADAVGRAICYKGLWVVLEGYFSDWEAKRKAAEASGQLQEFQPPADALAETLPIALAAAVQQAIASEAEDVTEAIKAALKAMGAAHEGQYICPAIFENALEPIDQAPNLDLVRSLSEIFRLQLEETLRISRGLESGKLDAKRLYRVSTTGKVFSQKEYHRENNLWNIIVLIDASSSVGWFWDQMKGIYAALAAALRGDNIKLEILAYREAADICQIKNLFYNNKLFTIDTEGDTPSGEAIIAAALRMPPGGQNLIMHITDGIKNVGVTVEYALEFCRLQGVDLITLGCGRAVRAFYPYGDGWELLGTSMDKLPHAVATLLKRKLVKRS